MKLHLIYFSPSGTTKKTVKNIAEGMSLDEVEEIDMLDKCNREKSYEFDENDLVILGMMTGTRLYGLPEEIFNTLKGNNTPFVSVVMFGNGYYGNSLILMKREMESRGFKMVAGGAFIGQSSLNPNIASGRPDAKDKAIHLDFGHQIYDKVIVNKKLSFDHSLSIDYSRDDTFTKVKCALGTHTPGVSVVMPKFMNELSIGDKCVGCKKCEKRCPVGAIDIDSMTIDRDKCIMCAACINGCPVKAIQMESKKLKKMMTKLETTRSIRREPVVHI
ncbi:4Fe-4S dicluster domain-containing protein [Acidaminobacter sp. JC074]|uniref:EFR1 family ferrodoxin n=1 Tax=Acidaminobacter sp. JC074 TaxID=2530199 RepID=UPI001F1129C2|nr:EFR1 family ferrodoxin [Acidaminobacter sp. JC074]MCH4887657.1 4Fe-4S dicluster domain-containing protein [Acidaminobacter sp. JC074]